MQIAHDRSYMFYPRRWHKVGLASCFSWQALEWPPVQMILLRFAMSVAKKLSLGKQS